MTAYSLPRNIWRGVYPALIFVGLVNVATLAVWLLLGEWLDLMWCSAIGDLVAGAVLLPIYLFSCREGDGFRRPGLLAPALLAFGAFVGFWFLFIGFVGATDVVRFFPDYQDLNDTIVNEGGFLSQFVAFALIGPVVEELCFRGIILKRLLKWLPTWAAILIQAALFGAAHLNLFQGLYAFCMGLLFGFLYARFRSIIVSTAAHFAFNFTQVMITAFIYRPALAEAAEDLEEATGGGISGSLVLLSIGVMMFAVFWFFLLRREKAAKIEPYEDGLSDFAL
jgi:membrane protease YdiL (CAAX protease family)